RLRRRKAFRARRSRWHGCSPSPKSRRRSSAPRRRGIWTTPSPRSISIFPKRRSPDWRRLTSRMRWWDSESRRRGQKTFVKTKAAPRGAALVGVSAVRLGGLSLDPRAGLLTRAGDRDLSRLQLFGDVALEVDVKQAVLQ